MQLFNKNSIAFKFSKTILYLMVAFFVLLVFLTFLTEIYRGVQSANHELLTKVAFDVKTIAMNIESLTGSVNRLAKSPISVNAMIETRLSTSYFKHLTDSLISESEILDAVIFGYDGNIKFEQSQQNKAWFEKSLVSSALAVGTDKVILRDNYAYIVSPIIYFNTPQGGIIARVDLKKIIEPIVERMTSNDYYRISILGNVVVNTIPQSYRGIRQTSWVRLRALTVELERFVTYIDIIKKMKSWLINIFILGLFCIILLTFVAREIGFKLARPIAELTNKIQNNNYPISPTGSNDELELLAQSFDQAREDLERVSLAKTEAQRRDRQSEVQSIVNTVLDGIITINTSGIVITFNPAAERIFGYVKDRVIGNNVKMLMPEPFYTEHDQYLNNYLTTGESKIMRSVRELTGRRSDGSIFPIELAVSEMWVANERFFTGTVRDISERKKGDKLKSEFVSTVSHELRTPLTSINGSLMLLKSNLQEQVSESTMNMLDIALRNTQRLTLLINDLLDLEKLSSGKIKLDFFEKDLNKILLRGIEDNQSYAHNNNVKLCLTLLNHEALIDCDENRILQIITNLISNAVKFSEADSHVDVLLTEEESNYKVQVKDYGSGIPEEFKDRIFERFAQANSSDSRPKGGTGLGLSISKRIIELHKGQINYESEQGEGSIFYFTIPKKNSFK